MVIDRVKVKVTLRSSKVKGGEGKDKSNNVSFLSLLVSVRLIVRIRGHHRLSCLASRSNF